MPQIKTVDMVGSTNIAADRITINNNMQMVAGAVNNLQNYLDIDNLQLIGLQNLTLFKGNENAASPNDFLFRTNGSVSALGSAIIGGAVTANTAKIATGLELTTGDFNMPNANSNINFGGNLNIGGEIVLTDFGLDGTITAFSKTYFQLSAASGENILLLDNNAVPIGGKVSLKGRNSIILDWTGFNPVNADTSLYEVMLMTNSTAVNSALRTGQVVEIMAQVPVDTPYPFYIVSDTLKYPGNSVFTAVKFTQPYQSLRVIYDGSNWVILSMTGCILV